MNDRSRKSRSPVCLSVYGKDLGVLRNKLKMAHNLHPEFVEIRLDYLEKADTWRPSQIKKLLQGNEILTFRSPTEGGVNAVPERVRVALLSELISEVEPRFFDIELSTLRKHPEFLERIESTKSMLIASTHDFSKTPALSHLNGIVRSAPKTRSLYALKVVCKATSFKDNVRLLSLYDYARKLSLKIIAFCMGEYGLYSRIACIDFGSPFTYVSLPSEATAPGQLDIGVMRTLLGGGLD